MEFCSAWQLSLPRIKRLLKYGRRLTLGIGDNREHCFYIPVGFHLMRLYIDQGFELEELASKRFCAFQLDINCFCLTGYQKTALLFCFWVGHVSLCSVWLFSVHSWIYRNIQKSTKRIFRSNDIKLYRWWYAFFIFDENLSSLTRKNVFRIRRSQYHSNEAHYSRSALICHYAQKRCNGYRVGIQTDRDACLWQIMCIPYGGKVRKGWW